MVDMDMMDNWTMSNGHGHGGHQHGGHRHGGHRHGGHSGYFSIYVLQYNVEQYNDIALQRCNAKMNNLRLSGKICFPSPTINQSCRHLHRERICSQNYIIRI